MKKPSPMPEGSPSVPWPGRGDGPRGDVGLAQRIEHQGRDAGSVVGDRDHDVAADQVAVISTRRRAKSTAFSTRLASP